MKIIASASFVLFALIQAFYGMKMKYLYPWCINTNIDIYQYTVPY